MIIERNRHGKRHSLRLIAASSEPHFSCQHNNGEFTVGVTTRHTFHGPYSETYCTTLSEDELTRLWERFQMFKLLVKESNT